MYIWKCGLSAFENSIEMEWWMRQQTFKTSKVHIPILKQVCVNYFKSTPNITATAINTTNLTPTPTPTPTTTSTSQRCPWARQRPPVPRPPLPHRAKHSGRFSTPLDIHPQRTAQGTQTVRHASNNITLQKKLSKTMSRVSERPLRSWINVKCVYRTDGRGGSHKGPAVLTRHHHSLAGVTYAPLHTNKNLTTMRDQ